MDLGADVLSLSCLPVLSQPVRGSHWGMSWVLMNPGVIDVQNSHKRACQPGDGWIFAGGGGGVGRYGVASWNWVIRALTVQTGAPRSAIQQRMVCPGLRLA